MTYTVTGKRRGKTYAVKWDNGRLRGTPYIKKLIQIEAESKEGIPVGPVGQYTESRHLKNPLSTLFIMADVFDSITEVTGDVPEAVEVPEGRKM